MGTPRQKDVNKSSTFGQVVSSWSVVGQWPDFDVFLTEIISVIMTAKIFRQIDVKTLSSFDVNVYANLWRLFAVSF